MSQEQDLQKEGVVQIKATFDTVAFLSTKYACKGNYFLPTSKESSSVLPMRPRNHPLRRSLKNRVFTVNHHYKMVAN